MKEKVDAVLDHLIAVHRIEQKKIPGKGLEKAVKLGIFLLGAFIIIKGAGRLFPDAVPTSSTVGDRELPIYCVETDQPKIALSFDAAWDADK